MRIAVYGGSGMIGSAVVEEARRRGHDVTSLSRRDGHDAADADEVASVAAGHDVVVSAIGPSREAGGDHEAFLDVVRGLVAAVSPARLAVVGGAGSLLGPDGTRLVDSPDFPAAYRREALTQSAQLTLLQDSRSDLDWVYLSPAPEIAPGPATGAVTLGLDQPAGPHVTTGDYAVALLDELEHPAHRRIRFTVASA